MKLWNYIKSCMLKHPNQLICEREAEITYEKLVFYTETLAKRLSGIKSCAILCNSEMASSMALLACFSQQITAVPLSMRYGKLHCEKILNTIKPEAIITDTDGKFSVIHINDIPINSDAALIMCTSGTTGIPKGAMLTDENIITNVKDICEYFNITTNDRILISRPLYHCAVLTGEFLTSLVKGVYIRFYSGEFNPVVICDIIKNCSITTFCGTPTLLSIIARFGKETSLKHICISGECMDSETGIKIQEAFPEAEIYHIYGLTEACPRVSYLPPNLFGDFPDCVGYPLSSVSLKILGHNGTEVKDGDEGILWVKGKNIMMGYYNDQIKTQEVLKDGWLCTGDIALINEAGLLKIKGRCDELIIRSGMNIYPAEIELAMKKDPRVGEVYVYGIKNSYGTQIGMKISGTFSNVDEVKKLCNEVLPAFQIPSKIELLEELEKNGSGKIIRGKNHA